jgi:hypothetical protein
MTRSRAALLLAFIGSLPSSLLAQAWLSPENQGTVSLLYQFGFDRYHAMSRGEAVDRGHTMLQALMVDVDYSFTDRLAVRLALPYIEGRYMGSQPHLLVRGQPNTIVQLDDGHYHGGFQDARFDVRYNVSREKLMVTPFFMLIVPSHAYATLGHGAIGTDQREYRMGVNLGRRLNPFLPRAYVQGRYAFGMVQQIAGVAPKRSYLEFQLGYVFTRRLFVQGSTVYNHSHNGIDFINGVFPNDLTEEQYLNHDRISRINLLDVGASVNYGITRRTNVFFGWGRSIEGTNTHLRDVVLTLGVTKSFSTRGGEGHMFAGAPTEPNKELVCTCAKSK